MKTETPMSYAEAMAQVMAGCRVRLRHWNDESYMALHEGRQTVFIGGSPTSCQPRDTETLSWEWRVCR
jgi:hypothetical protein